MACNEELMVAYIGGVQMIESLFRACSKVLHSGETIFGKRING